MKLELMYVLKKPKKSSKACFILKIVSVKPIKSKKNGIIGREAN